MESHSEDSDFFQHNFLLSLKPLEASKFRLFTFVRIVTLWHCANRIPFGENVKTCCMYQTQLSHPGLKNAGSVKIQIFLENSQKKTVITLYFHTVFAAKSEHCYTFFVALFRREAANFFIHILFLHFCCFKNENFLYFYTFFVWKNQVLHSEKSFKKTIFFIFFSKKKLNLAKILRSSLDNGQTSL